MGEVDLLSIRLQMGSFNRKGLQIHILQKQEDWELRQTQKELKLEAWATSIIQEEASSSHLMPEVKIDLFV